MRMSTCDVRTVLFTPLFLVPSTGEPYKFPHGVELGYNKNHTEQYL